MKSLMWVLAALVLLTSGIFIGYNSNPALAPIPVPSAKPVVVSSRLCTSSGWFSGGAEAYFCLDDKAGCYVLIAPTGSAIHCLRRRNEPSVTVTPTPTPTVTSKSYYQRIPLPTADDTVEESTYDYR